MPKRDKDDLYILGDIIKLGESKEVSFNLPKLHTRTPVDVPVIINRAKKNGPTILITAGIHGDEINGIEIVRQIIAKGINKPKIGTIICIPVINIFGFINMEREFPDGRDLNRVFPGSQTGSLASRIANKLVKEIVPHADFILDFHTGGALRFNAPQIRIQKGNKAFDNADKMGVPLLLFEGGKSFHIDKNVTNTGVNGAKRILNHYGMLSNKFKVSKPKKHCIYISESKWIRAKYSGSWKYYRSLW